MTRAEYLFPNRLTRRDLLALGVVATAGLSAPKLLAADDKPPVRIGSGAWTYELDEAWGLLPPGMTFGFGCGIVVDSKDRIYVTSRSANPCVAIFDPAGKLLEAWSKDFGDRVGYSPDQVAATAHGIYWSKEGNDEFLYFTENVAGEPNGPRLGARVYNVVDGYGSQRVSRFDKNFKHIKTIGSRGKEHGQFNTCHGVWISTLRDVPEVYIADRHNGRYEVYSLDLDYQRSVSGDFVRNPCCFYQHQGHLYIPDLASLVTIINSADQPVATLGDGSQGQKDAPDKFNAPHALTVDSQGNLYIADQRRVHPVLAQAPQLCR